MGFGGLYTSVSGLQAAKHSLNTISHNISNTNNPYYVRQSAIHADKRYRPVGATGLQIGTGVHVEQIRQIRDSFLDMQLRRELPQFGYFYAKAETLEDVEGVFNEITSSGLQEVMNDFWNTWDELSKDPSELTLRALVHESAVAFTDTVNHISNQLNDIERNIDRELVGKVSETNDLLDGIASINKLIKIQEAEGNHVTSNDLRDERNAMIDRLHQLIPVKTYEDHFGGTVVHLHGRDLVNGEFTSKLDIKAGVKENSGFHHVYWENSEDMIDFKGKGELGGLIDVRDKSLDMYKGKVNQLVKEIANGVNKLHMDGIGLDGSKNIPFFVTKLTTAGKDGDYSDIEGDITASNIMVNPALADLNKISVSKTGKPGDGSLSKDIYELRQSLEIELEDGEKKNIDDFYRNLVTTLALEREEALNNMKHQDFLIKALDEKRAEISKVSLDEEMADMIQFQYAYTANSRVINVIDEMIDTVVNRVGLVGR